MKASSRPKHYNIAKALHAFIFNACHSKLTWHMFKPSTCIKYSDISKQNDSCISNPYFEILSYILCYNIFEYNKLNRNSSKNDINVFYSDIKIYLNVISF